VIIVDKALEKRARDGDPIRVGLVGAGFSGRTIAYQITTAIPGIRIVAISNRTLAHADAAYRRAGASDVEIVESTSALDEAIRQSRPAITDDPSLLCRADGVEAIIEATGTVEFGACVAIDAVQHGKHVVLANAELDATLGPILKAYADRAGVIITNTDGDEPGVAMNMIRFVRSIGLHPVVTGNLKGLYDPYRTPDTQREFAAKHNQKPKAVASFADGKKISMDSVDSPATRYSRTIRRVEKCALCRWASPRAVD
jgi:predicted homoserine dehydrogenase-like protein